MDPTTTNQASFSGWAIVEVMGHNVFSGMVSTEAYGGAVLFRIDVPDFPEGEEILQSARYSEESGGYVPAGAKVKVERVPGYSKLIGAGSIYAITPCTEAAARAAAIANVRRPFSLLELPGPAGRKALMGRGIADSSPIDPDDLEEPRF
jgi:hypothetical protein